MKEISFTIRKNNAINLNFKDFFWFLYGCMVFVPLEIFYDGLWTAYFQIIFLFLISNKINLIKFCLFLMWCSLFALSTVLSNFEGVHNLINPLLIGLVLIVAKPNDRNLNFILYGAYLSAILYVVHMLYLLVKLDVNSLFMVLTSRDWGVGLVIGFGNGLAILFSVLMLFAYKQSKYFLLIIFFVGGVITTSRIPFIALAVILFASFFNFSNFRFKVVVSSILCVLFVVASFNDFLPKESEYELLENRMTTTEDRVDVYGLALSSFLEHPLLGVGADKLPEYEHAHNSYLQILSKYGMLGFIIWISLWYFSFFEKFDVFKNIDFVLIFFSISLFQIGLHNPNALILLIMYRWMFIISGENFKRVAYV